MGKKRGSRAAGATREGEEPGSGQQAAVLSLKMDSSTPEAPREVAESGTFQTPCSLSGLGAGVSGGTLGFVWGFGECGGCFWAAARHGAAGRTLRSMQQRSWLAWSWRRCVCFARNLPHAPCPVPNATGGYWIRNIKGGGQWKLSLGEGWASAKVQSPRRCATRSPSLCWPSSAACGGTLSLLNGSEP